MTRLDPLRDPMLGGTSDRSDPTLGRCISVRSMAANDSGSGSAGMDRAERRRRSARPFSEYRHVAKRVLLSLQGRATADGPDVRRLAAVAPLAELLDESRARWLPAEVCSSLVGCG